MGSRRVKCPGCSEMLEIPESYSGSKVQCSLCEAQFAIPSVSDQDVLDWIGTRNRDDTDILKPIEDLPEDILDEEVVEEEIPDTTNSTEPLRLVRFGRRGVLLEFPDTMLTDKSFRGAMPRRCLRCGTKANLQPHVIVFARTLMDSSTLEGEFVESRTTLSDHDARNLSIEQVLERLPEVLRVAAPANLPMPYWMCDMCNPANMILAMHERSKDSDGLCRIQIPRLWRVEEFLRAAVGEASLAYKTLGKVLTKNPEKPWDSLSGVVQHRLQQWYRPHKGERFVAYIPDTTRSRTESGMCGMVVSNRRLIFHDSMRHRESEKGEPLELQFAIESGKGLLRVKGPTWELKNIAVDKPGLQRLRHALTQQKFQAAWQ